jgi:hypothetical protein
MKSLMNSVQATHIGEVLALPGDYNLNDGLRCAAEFGNVPMTTYNSPFPDSRELLWERESSGDLRYKLGEWVIINNINVIVSPAYLSVRSVHHIAGRIVPLAAMDAAQQTNKPKVVLQGHGLNGVPGRWSAASGHPDLLMPASDSAPPMDTTYSVLTIKPGLLSGMQVNPETLTPV